MRHAFGRLDSGALLALMILGAAGLLALIGPLASPCAYDETALHRIGMPPALRSCQWFGTDALGRDLFVRTLIGARVSLAVGLLATLVSLVIGVLYGAIAGYLGGRVDALLMRFVDVLYALPFLFFVILLTVLFGRSLWLILLAIGAVEWLTMARIVRGQTLSLRRRAFVDAAVTGGLGTAAILRRHIVPNVLGPVIVYAALTVPQVILVESFLSFLGLGLQEPLTSLGRLIAEGVAGMESRPWLLLFPGGMLVLILFAFNLLGERLRRRLDDRPALQYGGLAGR